MSAHPDPREARLPKWAQDALNRTRAENGRLRAALETAKGADPRPPIAVRDVYGEAFPVAWDHYDEVRFRLNSSGDVEDARTWIAFRRRHQGELEVMASGVLTIKAQATNLIRLGVEDR